MTASNSLACPVLSDGVVLLRPFEQTDVEALMLIVSDPDIRKRNHVPEPTVGAVSDWIARELRRQMRGESITWAVCDATSGALAGRRTLRDVNLKEGTAETGAWIDPALRGCRFAGRSLLLVCDEATGIGIQRVRAFCDVDNLAAYFSLSRVMTHEGIARGLHLLDDGTRLDQHAFARLASDPRPAMLVSAERATA
jgi:RimJ/RimL family protein N-acetyltransferase